MTTETKDKQAVVDEAKGPAAPDTTVDSAQEGGSDLDSLLKEFESGTKVADSPPEPKPATDPPDWAKEIQRRYIQDDVKKVTDEIFDGLEVSDRLKSAWIDQIAREKPGVSRAFLNRQNDPATWNKVLRGLKPEALRDFPNAKKVDPEATADREAVAAAVRGASTKVAADPAPDFSKMSDAELSKWKQDNMK